jgi:hypothetical protein
VERLDDEVFASRFIPAVFPGVEVLLLATVVSGVGFDLLKNPIFDPSWAFFLSIFIDSLYISALAWRLGCVYP